MRWMSPLVNSAFGFDGIHEFLETKYIGVEI
jgi:hypothetical protein